ncbi:MAG: SDR family oxidoreductase [Mycobacterium sp.]
MALPPPSAGSVAVVTGASSGIGEQFARQLVARGYRVVVTARRAERLQELCAQLGGDEHGVAVSADLAVAEDRDRLAARIDELDAEVDILVNNAGLGIYTKFGAEGRDKELQMLRVDVEAVVDLTLRYLPGMVERGRGAIINLSSASGFQPGPYNAGYAAAKAYVLWLSEAVNVEVAASGVTVTAVCPGPVPTEFSATNDADFLIKRLAFAQVPPERVVADALRAADRGRASVVPGGPQVRFALGSTRFVPTPLALPVLARILKH